MDDWSFAACCQIGSEHKFACSSKMKKHVYDRMCSLCRTLSMYGGYVRVRSEYLYNKNIHNGICGLELLQMLIRIELEIIGQVYVSYLPSLQHQGYTLNKQHQHVRSREEDLM